jgi:hypothetical protein
MYGCACQWTVNLRLGRQRLQATGRVASMLVTALVRRAFAETMFYSEILRLRQYRMALLAMSCTLLPCTA